MNAPSCSTQPDQPYNAAQLVRLCAEAFGDDGDPVTDFPKCLFMVYEWLMESTEMMAQFIALYQDEYQKLGTKICYAVGFWIQTFPIHFDANTQLCKLVERLKQMATQDAIDENAVRELDVSTVPSYAWLRNVSVRNPVARQISLSFEQWSPEDISTSLSHIDYKVLSRVPIRKRSISVFNSLSNWVQCMILGKPLPKERADVITKFVNVGKHLRKVNNFNTLMAVIGGVTHSNISRLTKTMACLSADTKKDLNSLTQLVSAHNNFAQYRKILQETDRQFRIPIMGVHLKDLIILQSKGFDFDKTRIVGYKKLYQLANLLSHFLSVNRMSHNFPDANMDLITLKVLLDIGYNEDDIYVSLKREPRTLLNFQPPAKSVVFADWASGVCSAPDQDTVYKHISAMVEAVFKHYDYDKDSFISRAEFELIAGNFPFLDSFVLIDADKDGRISKSEMKAYFINVNKQLNEFRRGFKHNFHETTFLTPTLCIHCNKLVFSQTSSLSRDSDFIVNCLF
ncbi:hypothetical protein L596_013110 [Steinernema carpocapsae]|uniref:Ras guanyl-releasing protein 3 n=1 Tax=Steinernema carpocapsae TaxID=34508 RepID=A0A4U5P014_STECR|nr:hypothetical protein L596_013110 [Steinernema carpocapsae]